MRALGPIALLTTLGGCQAYRPAPLDLSAHAAAWSARDPASPGVVAYAQQLSATGPSGGGGSPTGIATPPYDPADGLTLPEARVVALFFNPQLRAARLRARVPAAGAAEAGRWEDPALQVNAERIVQSVRNPWVVGGLLNVTLPLSGRPALVRGRALAEADVAAANALLEEQRILAELDTAWTDLALADARLRLARAFLADLDAVAASAEQLARAGELRPAEAGLFRVERARRRADVRSLEPERREKAIAVAALMGLTPEADVRLVPALPDAAPQDDRAARKRWVAAHHPRLRLARAEYAAAERQLELEVRRQFPDLTIGGGYNRDEATNRVLGGLNIPIPVFNANRRAIAEARAERDAARAAAEATVEDVLSTLARAEAAADAARVRREALEREVAPAADEQLRAARDLGRLGDAGTVVLFEALTRAHEARLELLEAAGREAAAQNRLAALLRPALGVDPDAKETP